MMHRLRNINLLFVLTLLGTGLFLVVPKVSAQTCYDTERQAKQACQLDKKDTQNHQLESGHCYVAVVPKGATAVSYYKETSCSSSSLPIDATCYANNDTTSKNTNIGECTIFKKYIFPIINLLTILVGIIVTIMIVAGGIRYSSSGGDPQAVNAAKKMIFNAILALVGFGLLWAFLNWIVPGGVF